MRDVFISNNDAQESLQEYLGQFQFQPQTEEVSLAEALGRVTACPHAAKVCDPMYNAAAMDGIMVRSASTFGASELNPIRLKQSEDFEYINTGGQITGTFDAVIMIEDVTTKEAGVVEIINGAYPWQHIRVVGESIVSGEMILPSNHKIRPVDLGALAAGGYSAVTVYKKPRIGIIPTGAELVENPLAAGPGKLVESNSYVFAALVAEYGGTAQKYPIVRDEIDSLRAAIRAALSENDIVVLNAGTSAGTKDFTLNVIEELGEVFRHGLAIKPGKPTILAKIDQKPVLGIPGYPVSAYLMFDKFVRPLIGGYLGNAGGQAQPSIEAVVTKTLVSSMKNEEIIRVALGFVGGKYIATPLERGAAAIMSLVKADGKLVIDRLSEGIHAGETAKVLLLKPLEDIEKTLTVIGSHDLIIDVIADKMHISSAHVGSMGGISAIKKGECHIAPIHLMDEETGEYNISYVKKYLPDKKMVLIKGVGRVQGLMVPKGNPLGLKDFKSLPGVRFANRQRGAGTRLLLDYWLKKEGIAPEDIEGYEKEFSTHMAVAIAVKTNNCDAGLGILAAAKAMDLDFIPLANEEYDFLVPEEYLEEPRVQQFVEILKSEDFRRQLDELSGYTYERIGEIVRL